MKITIRVEGEILTKREPIECEIDLPKDWTPTFEQYCKVKGALRMMVERLAQEYEPEPNLN